MTVINNYILHMLNICTLTFGEMPFSAFPWFSLRISMQVLSVIKDALILPKEGKRITEHC